MKQELKIIYNDMIKPVGKSSYDIASGFFAFPTKIRKVASNIRILSIDATIEKEFFRFFGSIAGMFYSAMSLIKVPEDYYDDKINGTTALLLLTPLATNLVSGAYEIWRYARNKAKASAFILTSSKTSSSGLETKVEETEINIEKQEIKPQLPKYEIPNPWDIDIDEIEDARYLGLNDYRRGN